MEHTQVAIIGSGPAGYTAAVYNARAQLQPIVFAGDKSGGQLMWTTDVENFPGFSQGKPGPELMMEMRAQAEKFGADIRDQYVISVDFSVRPFKLQIYQSEEITADAVIIATGAEARMMGIPGEKEFLGRGVSTCAVCDAAFFKDKVVYVAGGGDSAMEDTLALTKFAKKITLVHRSDEFRASKIMQERVLNNDKVKVMYNSQVTAVLGAQLVNKIKISQDGKEQEFPADGLFLAIGHTPMSKIFIDQIKLDEQGYIITFESKKSTTMTSVEGVFAAGDVVDRRYRQAITAAGMGCAAALDAQRWLEQQE
ncbi:thioredoxin-disulfide reductase [Patescibacteria group bacterium]|nr:thioredoxin-disulfide reductase [Patescibacteria group bacterium]MBU1967088.1 thioredoxin-disulfide reductase [Patescibacteria group bacterium]MBU2543262.1 thioredoxin-disulfide reductase [Patescibacteria group bacterium]